MADDIFAATAPLDIETEYMAPAATTTTTTSSANGQGDEEASSFPAATTTSTTTTGSGADDQMKDLFGSDDEDEAFNPAAEVPAGVEAEAEEDDEIAAGKKKLKKLRKKKSKKRKARDSDDDESAEEKPKRKRRKKRASRSKGGDDEVDGGEITGEVEAEMGRGKRRKASKESAIKTQEAIQAEQAMMGLVVTFLEKMNKACDDDIQANRNKAPAINKLNMLEDVMNMVHKANLHERLLDSHMLSAIRKWLEPLPDKTLPNVTIRESLLKALLMLNPPRNDSQYWQYRLKESGIGRIVMFLYKNDEVPTHRRMAGQLIERWSRPVFDLQERWTGQQREEEQARLSALPRTPDASLDAPKVPAGTANFKVKDLKFPTKAGMNYIRRPRDLVDPEAKKDRTLSRVATFDKRLKGETVKKGMSVDPTDED